MNNLKVFGKQIIDDKCITQMQNCLSEDDLGVLTADAHYGYGHPIGGVAAYKNKISLSGVGFDIACIVENTPIMTSGRYTLPIQSISADESILCSDIDNHKIQINTANKGVVDKGMKESVELNLLGGKSISLTTDHLLYTKDGWKKVEDIKLGEYVATSSFEGFPFKGIDWSLLPNIPYKEPYQFSAFLRLLGVVNGDGHIIKNKRIVSIYSSELDFVDEVVADIKLLNLSYTVHRVKKRKEHHQDLSYIYIYNTEFGNLLESLGCPVGKKVWNLSKIKWILNLPQWAIAQYVSGFCSAEMSTPTINLNKQINPLALKQSERLHHQDSIQFYELCLSALDIRSSTHLSVKSETRNIWVNQITNGIVGQLRFIEKVGFCYSVKKRIAAAKIISFYLTNEKHISNKLAAKKYVTKLVTTTTVAKAIQITSELFNVSKNWLLHSLYSLKDKHPKTIKGFVIEDNSIGEIVWRELLFIESKGIQQVYDIVTEDVNHNFIADGIVVHNCGNKAIRTNVLVNDINIPKVMDEIFKRISFGVGRHNDEPIDHEVFDKINNADFKPQRDLLQLAKNQLGTVGSGNHYIDLFSDKDGYLWIGNHFGSRGFGHKTAMGFIAMSQGLSFKDKGNEGSMDKPPILFDVSSEIGQSYLSAMHLAGEYAYAGRDVVVNKVLEILGNPEVDFSVHNHHNFTWKENHFGSDYWVVRKGCTPAFPGQLGFIGSNMLDSSVIIEGVESELSKDTLYSTVHGAGRVMSRTEAAGKKKWIKDDDGVKRPTIVAKGKVDFDAVKEQMKTSNIELRGAGADEAPACYKKLHEVLGYMGDTIKILHVLHPIGVAMAGSETFDPYKD